MNAVKIILKVLAALAAVAGVVYVIATYGDKIVAWAKKLMGNKCCCDCTDECDECECECDEFVEECDEEPVEEEIAEEEVVASDVDFEG